jgi:hypothetical protein
MGFITHRRGHLHEYSGEFDESMLLEEVTLDEYLAQQYPPVLLEKFPEQARADRDREQSEIQAATVRATPSGSGVTFISRTGPMDLRSSLGALR